MADILIVDDDAALRGVLAETIRDLGHTPHCAASGAAALAALADRDFDAMLLDLRMPQMDGMTVLQRLRTMKNATPVAVLTAHATTTNTIEAMRLGAFDHLVKPIGRRELAQVLAAMLASRKRGHPMVADESDGLIGSTEAMRAVQKRIGMLSDSDATVLVTGETGTGKELVARAIHQHGRRASHAFVAINAAAIPADLLESELFGHFKGAFTGAASDRLGAFREAHGGTLFLDEIGDMALAMQAKILRTLQERVVVPVGGKAVPVDVRIIAATHHDLPRLVAENRFREDLFYRLNVVPVTLPPLRERLADIVLLAEHFLLQCSGKRLSAAAAAILLKHDWPGNVRELRNAMERAAVLIRGQEVDAPDLDFVGAPGTVASPTRGRIEWPDEDLPTAVARLEELLIRRALARHLGNRSQAARDLNIHRQLLYAKIRQYGIDVSGDHTDTVANPD